MSLTERGYYEQKWGDFPLLGRLVGHEKPGRNWESWSTARPSIFESVGMLLQVYATVESHRAAIVSAGLQDPEIMFPIARDLERLRWKLASLREMTQEWDELLSQLEHECDAAASQRRRAE